ncbi:glycosyltransferase [Bradyrhizobium sp. Tv2a-2]|uniref:glycosyltransferase n=1 Tax=Bradyrhizobium sp. Tv2a-2 TaxID=113395 RepID=UPI0003FEAB26|nr:glycosyltransferase [Bradyrhizobium sp. Tv2a-2]
MSLAEQSVKNDYDIIAESGLFDRGFYLRSNPDVAEALLDPLAHFCDYGWRERRDPAPFFSLRFYMIAAGATEKISGNPFVHYILEGRSKGFRTRPEAMGPVEPIPPIRAAQWKSLTPRTEACGLDVIVPVYRGLADTAACIYSVLTAKVQISFRLIVVNDKSPEPGVTKLLNALARRKLLLYIENIENKGFVISANKGMAVDREAHKLLLNSDTIVYDGWLDRICAHAQNGRVGTITPLSNNATIFSYPDPNASNNYSIELSLRDLDLAASVVGQGCSVEVPTGVGFCMFIHRDCYGEVGELDAETFAKGYGEENDFCIRATQMGWKNVAATDVLVRHTGEVSFALDAAAQQKSGYISLLKKHPRYEASIKRFVSRDPLKAVRQRLDLARLSFALDRDNVLLLISHNQGGGIDTHIKQHCEMLDGDFGVLALTPNRIKSGEYALNLQRNPLYLPNLGALNESELLKSLEVLFKDKRNCVVHLHSAVGFNIKKLASVLRALRSWGVRIVSTIHDYSPICPRNQLIDDSEDYCGLPGPVECNACARIGLSTSRVQEFSSIATYRAGYLELLGCAERTFVPSEDARTRLQPFLRTISIETKPHLEPTPKRGKQRRWRVRSASRSKEILRVGVIGAIGPHKGSSVLFGCASDAMRRELELDFRVIGYTDIDDRLRKLNVSITGPYYSQEALQTEIEDYAPDIAFFPSVWPETYLYTLSDAFNHRLFPVAFDIGAPAERISEAGWGALIDFNERFNFSFINDSLLELRTEKENGAPSMRRITENPAHYYGYPTGVGDGGKPALPTIVDRAS